MNWRMSRRSGELAFFLFLSAVFLQSIEAVLLGTIYSQPNDPQDFFVHILCLDIASHQDCCHGARDALEKLSLEVNEECAQQVSLVPTHQKGTMHSLSFQSKQVNSTGWISPQEGIVRNTPLSFMWDDRESKMLSHNVPWKEVMSLLATGSQQTIPVCIESSLFGSGMHREIRYKLHTTRDLTALDVLIHLPADVFVNKEDAIAHSWNTQFIEIVTTDTIDLEEPTFASPPHALILRFGETKQDASFSLKIHLRYPEPLVSGDFRRIMLPPALGMSGTAEANEQMMTIVTDNSCAHPIQIWSASGHVTDLSLTLVATIGVALLGAAVMLRDLSKVTVWL